MDIAARVMSVVSRSSGSEDRDGAATSSQQQPRVGMVVDVGDAAFIGGFIPSLVEKQRYPYSRPEFLYFVDEEVALSADHAVRPVICPKQPSKMPLFAGYAEVINSGKTVQNEDQASARLLSLVQQGYEAEEAREIQPQKVGANGEGLAKTEDDDPLLSPTADDVDSSPLCVPRADAALFSIFDGHAGTAVAIVAAKCLHEHVKSRLSEVLETILNLDRQENLNFGKHRSESSYSMTKLPEERISIRSDQLVKGALETAFADMDDQIAEDKQVWRLPGGCAVISVLVLLGKLYVANAGDCRAILVTSSGAKALSRDLTPASERKRLQQIAYQSPELIGNAFSRLEYSRRLTKKDIRTKVLYRDWFMDGWAAKTVKDTDLRPPLISNSIRKKRLLNTIGVSRGFGDHHLLTVEERLCIKPFLSAVPELSVTNLRELDTLTDKDVVIVASDGLWDVLTNEDAGLIVRSTLGSTDSGDPTRYCLAAQDLVIAARGNPSTSNVHKWSMATGGHASCDDITVFVIPLKYCAAPPPNPDDDDDDEEMISLS